MVAAGRGKASRSPAAWRRGAGSATSQGSGARFKRGATLHDAPHLAVIYVAHHSPFKMQRRLRPDAADGSSAATASREIPGPGGVPADGRRRRRASSGRSPVGSRPTPLERDETPLASPHRTSHAQTHLAGTGRTHAATLESRSSLLQSVSLWLAPHSTAQHRAALQSLAEHRALWKAPALILEPGRRSPSSLRWLPAGPQLQRALTLALAGTRPLRDEAGGWVGGNPLLARRRSPGAGGARGCTRLSPARALGSARTLSSGQRGLAGQTTGIPRLGTTTLTANPFKICVKTRERARVDASDSSPTIDYVNTADRHGSGTTRSTFPENGTACSDRAELSGAAGGAAAAAPLHSYRWAADSLALLCLAAVRCSLTLGPVAPLRAPPCCLPAGSLPASSDPSAACQLCLPCFHPEEYCTTMYQHLHPAAL